MGLLATQKVRANISPLNAGIYIATCVGVVDLGIQEVKRWNKKTAQVMFIFEIADEFVEVDGEQKPRWQSAVFTNSIHEKSKLAAALKAWRGCDFSQQELEEGFDCSVLLGASCQIQVFKENGDYGEYNYIQTIMGLPKGMPSPKPLSDMIIFDMDSDIDTVNRTLELLPLWIQEKIKNSCTWADINANTKTLNPDSVSMQNQNTQSQAQEESEPTNSQTESFQDFSSLDSEIGNTFDFDTDIPF